MDYVIEAACGCDRGRVRKNNEDNFFFNGRCLEAENNGLRNPVTMRTADREVFFAVFDGMGGEEYGEYAAFSAANSVRESVSKLENYYVREKDFLTDIVLRANNKVVEKAHELQTSHMGSTIAALFFSQGNVYACNVGDSRVYRLRQGVFQQLSEDHIDHRENGHKTKGSLTQYLGVNPEEFIVEPYIAKGELRRGDRYLICSDGISDMITNLEIAGLIMNSDDPSECVTMLIDAALEKGGKDNATAILCFIK